MRTEAVLCALFLALASACTTSGGPPVAASLGAARDGGALRDAAFDAIAAAASDAQAHGGGTADAKGGGAIDWRGEVIYLVMPDRFQDGNPANDASGVAGCYDPRDPKKFHGGDLAGLRQRIPYLRDLGVTAIWITPQVRQVASGCGYHGYWADYAYPDDGALEPRMGTADDLTGLAADLHAASMHLILDLVVNHSGPAARIVAEKPSWFHSPSTCASLGDPNVYCPLFGLPDFAQENPVVATYLTAMSVGWATRFAIDGIRMDTVHNVLPSYWQASFFPAIRAARPGIFVVGEDFDESSASALLPYLDDGFDSLFDYPRYAAIVSAFAGGGTVDAVANAVGDAIKTYGTARASAMTTFVDNHDNPRFPSQFPSGANEAQIVARFGLALGAMFTLPGTPEIVWGDELAMYGAADPDNRRDMPSWAWTAATRAGAHPGESAGDGQLAYTTMQTLIAARKAHPALQRGSYVELWRQNGGGANLYAYYRGAPGDAIVVAINVGSASSASLPIAANDNLTATDRSALSDGAVLDDILGPGAPASVTISGGALALTLPADSMAIYAAK
jgi:alpha-amylase